MASDGSLVQWLAVERVTLQFEAGSQPLDLRDKNLRFAFARKTLRNTKAECAVAASCGIAAAVEPMTVGLSSHVEVVVHLVEGDCQFVGAGLLMWLQNRVQAIDSTYDRTRRPPQN